MKNKLLASALAFMIFTQNSALAVSAASNLNGKINDEYIAVINTSLTTEQSTGTLVFDDKNVATASANSERNKMSSDLLKALEEHKHNHTHDESTHEHTHTKTQPTITKTYKLGDTRDMSGKNYTVIGIGDKCYIWMDTNLKKEYDAKNITTTAANDMINVYEGAPYRIINSMYDGDIPYEDGSGKMSIVLEEMSGRNGFYSPSDIGITTVHIKTPESKRYFSGFFEKNIRDILVHETQHALLHMISAENDMASTNAFLWLNEGLAVIVGSEVEALLDDSFIKLINGSDNVRNGSPLVYSSYRNTLDIDYAMPYLFSRYLINQKYHTYNPIDFMRIFYSVKMKGKTEEQFLNELLKKLNIKGINNIQDALQNFYAAAFAQEPVGLHGFYGDPIVYNSLTNYPVYYGVSNTQINLKPSAGIIIKAPSNGFTIPNDAGKDIKFVGVKRRNNTYPLKGAGTKESPYLIEKANDLYGLVGFKDSHFKLTNDIDLTNKRWVPVSNFNGVLDGNGKTIKNLDNVLFANIESNGVVKNINMISDLKGEFLSDMGVLVKTLKGTVRNVHITGKAYLKHLGSSPTSPANFGVIAGRTYYGALIENSSSDVEVKISLPAFSSYVGGLVGHQQGNVKNSYSKGSINAIHEFNTSAPMNVGGLFGRLDSQIRGSFIQNVYSTTTITMKADKLENKHKHIGQLVGIETSSLGSTKHDITNVYALNTNYKAGGQDTAYINTKASIKTEYEMKQQATFVGFDFNSIWKINNNYPEHKKSSDINTITATLKISDYYIGEGIYLTDNTLNVDGGTVTLTKDMLDLDKWDTATVGNKTIKGNYNGKEFTITYNVKNPTQVKNLKVEPNHKGKTDYVENDTYSLNGVILKADVGRGYDVELYTGFTHDKQNKQLKLTDKEVTITYENNTVKLPISVKIKVVTGIEMIKQPDKKTFDVGATINLSGALFRLHYNDGTKSQMFGHSDFGTHNIKIAQLKNNIYKEFDEKTVLSRNDNNTDFYLYINALPDTANSINTKVFNIAVISSISLNTQNLYFNVGENDWADSEKIQGGSGEYHSIHISGQMPNGINLYKQPDKNKPYNNPNYFAFDGTATKKGIYPLVYKIEDIKTKDSIEVTINIHVVDKGTEADIESYTLSSYDNTRKYNGTINGTNITINIPQNENIKKLNGFATLSRGATSNPPTNMMGVDFSQPKTYTITSEDKSTTKTYKVTVNQMENIASNVTVSPDITNAFQGETIGFISKVTGSGTFEQSVNWSLADNTSQNTIIDNMGGLYIATDETASRIKVIATSATNPSASGTAFVTVIPLPKIEKAKNLKWNNGIANWDKVKDATSYLVSLYKDDVLVNGSEQTTNSTSVDFTGMITQNGKYTFKVIANGNPKNFKSSDEEVSSNYDYTIPASISSVKVTPNIVSLALGGTQKFTANVTGSNVTSQDVTFTITGHNDKNGTTINNTGELTVSNSETAKTITVTATSTIDTGISGSATVNITLNPLSVPQNIKIDKTVASWDKVSNAIGYKLQLVKDGVTLGDAININSKDTVTYDFKDLMTISGKYKFTIIALGNTTTNGNSSEATSNEIDFKAPPVVTAVEVHPNIVSIQKGQTQQFTANVIGLNHPSQGVTWKISNNKSTNTKIDSKGLLTVGSDEVSNSLTVIAKSTANTNVEGKVIVKLTLPKLLAPTNLDFKDTVAYWDKVANATNYTVQLLKNGNMVLNSSNTVNDTKFDFKDFMQDNGKYTFKVFANGDDILNLDSDFAESNILNYIAPPTVTTVDIDPNTATLTKGGTLKFNAIVNGTNNPPQTVDWTVTNNNSSKTTINKDGVLTVAIDETSSALNVVATSTYDTNVNATSSINLTLAPLDMPSNLIFNDTIASFDTVDNAVNYTISLYKDGVLVKDSKKEITTNIFDFKDLMTLSGDYTFSVFATGDMNSYGYSDVAKSNVNSFIAPAIVTDIVVTPDTVTVEQGKTQEFDITVNGYNNPSQDVIFTINDSTSQDTTITENGTLSVGLDEQIKEFTISVSSSLNKNIVKTITVNVILMKVDAPQNLKWHNNVAMWDDVPLASSYIVYLYKDENLVATKEISKNFIDLEEFMSENGNYKFKVVAKGDGINNDNSLEVLSEIITINKVVDTLPPTNNDIVDTDNNTTDEVIDSDIVVDENNDNINDEIIEDTTDNPLDSTNDNNTINNNNSNNIDKEPNKNKKIKPATAVAGVAVAATAVAGTAMAVTGTTATAVAGAISASASNTVSGIVGILKKLLSLLIK